MLAKMEVGFRFKAATEINSHFADNFLTRHLAAVPPTSSNNLLIVTVYFLSETDVNTFHFPTSTLVQIPLVLVFPLVPQCSIDICLINVGI